MERKQSKQRKQRKDRKPEEPNFVEIAEKIYEELRPLPADIRAEAVYHLLRMVDDEPVDPEIEKAWIEEIERRAEEMRSGKVKGIPAEEVFAKLRKKYPSPSKR